MDAIQSQNLSDYLVVRRLLIRAREREETREGRPVKVRTALDEFREDQALLSGGETPPQEHKEPHRIPKADDVVMRLSDLTAKIHHRPRAGVGTEARVEETVVVEEELRVEEYDLAEVEGLVKRSRNLVESDRYRFEFIDGTTLKIVDKWSGKSTTIWGDPHVDLSDLAGSTNGDFKDLTRSDRHTTFMLLDGTRLTITAKDDGVIEEVDLYRDGEHIRGLGSGSKEGNGKLGLFAGVVDSVGSTGSTVPVGDVVYAGGDGNDWFDAARRLVWGKTTGPVILSRPVSLIQVSYWYEETRQVAVTVNEGA